MSHWIGVGHSDIGLVRTMNQDRLAVLNERGFWAVADGMGGHAGGEVAAQLSIDTARHYLERATGPGRDTPASPQAILQGLMAAAHASVRESAAASPALAQMGTTLVALLLTDQPEPVAHIAHMGDSRAYRFRENTLTLLTRDHTLIERYLALGVLTPAMARTHPERHVLTKAVGFSSTAEPDIASHPLLPGDLLLLCSDGLTKMLTDEDIAVVLGQTGNHPAIACQELIAAALSQGGEDNVTVIVIGQTPRTAVPT